MSAFDSGQHPRDTTGKFDSKAQTPPEPAVLLSGIQTVDEFLAGAARRPAEDKAYIRSTGFIDDLTVRVDGGGAST